MPTLVLHRREIVPRPERFQIERRLRQRLVRELGQRQLTRPGSDT